MPDNQQVIANMPTRQYEGKINWLAISSLSIGILSLLMLAIPVLVLLIVIKLSPNIHLSVEQLVTSTFPEMVLGFFFCLFCLLLPLGGLVLGVISFPRKKEYKKGYFWITLVAITTNILGIITNFSVYSPILLILVITFLLMLIS